MYKMNNNDSKLSITNVYRRLYCMSFSVHSDKHQCTQLLHHSLTTASLLPLHSLITHSLTSALLLPLHSLTTPFPLPHHSLTPPSPLPHHSLTTPSPLPHHYLATPSPPPHHSLNTPSMLPVRRTPQLAAFCRVPLIGLDVTPAAEVLQYPPSDMRKTHENN